MTDLAATLAALPAWTPYVVGLATLAALVAMVVVGLAVDIEDSWD